MPATRKKGLLLWVKPRRTVSEDERTLASFPLLISISTGILSHLSVVNWKRPTWRRGCSHFCFFQCGTSCSLNTSAPTERLRTMAVTQGTSELSWQLFNLRKGHQLGQPEQVHVCLVLHQDKPHVHLKAWWDGAAPAAPRGCLTGASQTEHPLCSLTQWSLGAKNMSSWRAMGPSPPGTPHLFREPCSGSIQRTPK